MYKILPPYQLLHSLLIYDEETGLLYRKSNNKLASRAYKAGGNKFYYCINLNGVRYYAHRIVWKMLYNEEPPEQIDHDDGNGLNNVRSNLLNSDKLKNNHNKRKYNTNKSGHCGINWSASNQKWKATIGIDGIAKHLGYFDDIEEAIKVRENEELKYNFSKNHGDSRPL